MGLSAFERALSAEARSNTRLLDAFRASATACLILFEGWVTRGGPTDVDRLVARTGLGLLGAYFVLAFFWLVLAPRGGWAKYAATAGDLTFCALVFHLIYHTQAPEPVHYPYLPAFLMSLTLTTTTLRHSPACTLFGGVFALVAYVALGQRWSFPPEVLVLASLLLALVTSLGGIAVARTLRLAAAAAAASLEQARLERQVAPAAAERLALRGPDALAVQTAELSVLALRLPALGPLVDLHTPREGAELVERMHDAVAELVFRHGGTIDRLTGDGALAIFGAPLAQPDHPRRAAATAVGLGSALVAAGILPAEGPQRLAIGVTSGEAMVGALGLRGDYLAVGEVVDLALALCDRAAAQGGGVLTIDRMVARLGGGFPCDPVPQVTLGQRNRPLAVFALRELPESRPAEPAAESSPPEISGTG